MFGRKANRIAELEKDIRFWKKEYDKLTNEYEDKIKKINEKFDAEIEERVNQARIEVINKEALAEREAQTFRGIEKAEPIADAGTRTVVAKKASKKAK